MDRIAGQEVGAASSLNAVDKLRWVDLTAGDGAVDVDAGEQWERDCSPGILASHARSSLKRIDVVLHEIQPSTFDRLTKNLDEHLPALGYQPAGANVWIYRNVILQALPLSGSTATVHPVIDGRTAVMAFNDPNAITDWAMRPTFAREVRSRTPWFRAMSTMGCNPGGLKRLPAEDRSGWFDRIREQGSVLPPHHDLLLAEIEKDDAQWAYLLCEPEKWRDRAERHVQAAFSSQNMGVNYAWRRTQPDAFHEIQGRLFLTKRERVGQ